MLAVSVTASAHVPNLRAYDDEEMPPLVDRPAVVPSSIFFNFGNIDKLKTDPTPSHKADFADDVDVDEMEEHSDMPPLVERPAYMANYSYNYNNDYGEEHDYPPALTLSPPPPPPPGFGAMTYNFMTSPGYGGYGAEEGDGEGRFEIVEENMVVPQVPTSPTFVNSSPVPTAYSPTSTTLNNPISPTTTSFSEFYASPSPPALDPIHPASNPDLNLNDPAATNDDDDDTAKDTTKARTSRSRKPIRDASYIPRPPNAFIIFRSSFIKAKKIPGDIEGKHSSLSKICGHVWKKLPPAERAIWDAKAADALSAHRERYPHWRFSPGDNKAALNNMNIANMGSASFSAREWKPGVEWEWGGGGGGDGGGGNEEDGGGGGGRKGKGGKGGVKKGRGGGKAKKKSAGVGTEARDQDGRGSGDGKARGGSKKRKRAGNIDAAEDVDSTLDIEEDNGRKKAGRKTRVTRPTTTPAVNEQPSPDSDSTSSSDPPKTSTTKSTRASTEERCMQIATFLHSGLKGEELANAMKEWEAERAVKERGEVDRVEVVDEKTEKKEDATLRSDAARLARAQVEHVQTKVKTKEHATTTAKEDTTTDIDATKVLNVAQWRDVQVKREARSESPVVRLGLGNARAGAQGVDGVPLTSMFRRRGSVPIVPIDAMDRAAAYAHAQGQAQSASVYGYGQMQMYEVGCRGAVNGWNASETPTSATNITYPSYTSNIAPFNTTFAQATSTYEAADGTSTSPQTETTNLNPNPPLSTYSTLTDWAGQANTIAGDMASQQQANTCLASKDYAWASYPANATVTAFPNRTSVTPDLYYSASAPSPSAASYASVSTPVAETVLNSFETNPLPYSASSSSPADLTYAGTPQTFCDSPAPSTPGDSTVLNGPTMYSHEEGPNTWKDTFAWYECYGAGVGAAAVKGVVAYPEGGLYEELERV